MKIISTKKLTYSEREQLMLQGISLIEHNFISIELVDFSVDTLADYLIFTSQNAVRSVLKNSQIEKIKQKKVLCVGEKTKQMLIEQGWQVIENAPYAQMLGTIIFQKYSEKSFTFFCGNLRSDTLLDLCRNVGINCTEIIVYHTQYTSLFIQEKTEGILFFSPSAIHSFLLKNTISNEKLFCIGETTAQALQVYGKNCIIANKPTIDSVIESVIQYFNENKNVRK